jgi:hypothetical protein
MFPVVSTGRAIIATDPMIEMDARGHSLVAWFMEPLRLRRFLGFADLINSAGMRVSASMHTVRAAMSDFVKKPFTTYLLNGIKPFHLVWCGVCVSLW